MFVVARWKEGKLHLQIHVVGPQSPCLSYYVNTKPRKQVDTGFFPSSKHFYEQPLRFPGRTQVKHTFSSQRPVCSWAREVTHTKSITV